LARQAGCSCRGGFIAVLAEGCNRVVVGVDHLDAEQPEIRVEDPAKRIDTEAGAFAHAMARVARHVRRIGRKTETRPQGPLTRYVKDLERIAKATELTEWANVVQYLSFK
jgi:hypothetical protein